MNTLENSLSRCHSLAGAALACIALLTISADLPAQVTLQTAFSNLTFSSPVGLYAPPDTTNRVFLVTQAGVIYVFPNQSTVTTPGVFLDLTDTVLSGGELGLLGLAFHPDFRHNGTFFVYYTVNNQVDGFPYASVVSKFHVSVSNPDSADRTSEVGLMRINQPFTNHKAGQLAFSPRDGDLYIGLGDGGSGGDPFGNGQSLTTWLGKILRINVDSASAGLHYSIPSDNPFVHDTAVGTKKEIYAFGLRNPWRFSFDPATGALWVGDVGQDLWEEVDTIMAGGDYGWNIMEGTHCYNPPSGCDTSGLRMPLLDYGHVNSQCSVIGGFVYRGSSIPALKGWYVYGDYCAGRIWAMDSRSPGLSTNKVLLNSGKLISAFGVDGQQELYLCSYGDGKLFKFTPTPPSVPVLLQPGSGQVDVSRNPTLVWGNTYNAAGYHFQVSSDSTFSTIGINDSTAGDTSRQIGTLAYSTKYFWRVAASNIGGTSAFSIVGSFRTVDPPTPPPAPLLLAPANGATNQPSIVRLRWMSASTAASYRCQLAFDSVFTHLSVDDSTLADTSRQVVQLLSDTLYYWRVRGGNPAGNSPYSEVWSFRTSHLSTVLSVLRNWNLVSVPVLAADPSANVVFPAAASEAFGYVPGTGYHAADSLGNGSGYWVKFYATQAISISGTPLIGDSTGVAADWNLIGSVGVPLAVTEIQSSPPGLVTSQFFAYDGRYAVADTIRPGGGYWVKVQQAGTLYLTTSASSLNLHNSSVVGPIRIVPGSDAPPAPPSRDDSLFTSGSGGDIPSHYSLDQTYPNPFNPAAVIHYELPGNSFVRLRIYDVLGHEVARVVDGVQEAGYKIARWSAAGLPSGIYLCRMEAVDVNDASRKFVQVRKMVLLK